MSAWFRKRSRSFLSFRDSDPSPEQRRALMETVTGLSAAVVYEWGVPIGVTASGYPMGGAGSNQGLCCALKF